MFRHKTARNNRLPPKNLLTLSRRLDATENNAMPANPSPPEDQAVPFETDDRGMKRAINQARMTLPDFFRAFAHPTASQTGFCLKVRFASGNDVEHIWLADIDASKLPLAGTIGNEPRLDGFTFMQRVSFKIPDVSDWMYVENGYLVGGYTTKLIRSRLSSEKRANLDAELPFKISDGS